MVRPPFRRLLWGLPAAAGLSLGLVSCGGDPVVGEAYTTTTFVAAADLNGDGKVDLVDSIYAQGGGYVDSGYVSTRIQSGTETGRYLDPVRSDAGPNPDLLAVAPLSPGGAPGVVAVNRNLGATSSVTGTVAVLYPDPARPGGFLPPVRLVLQAPDATGVAVGDLDGDTWPDVAVAANGGSRLLIFKQAAGGGSFAAPVSLPVAGVPTSLALADLNGDGALDIVATCANGQLSILIQNGDGTFQAHQDFGVAPNPVCVKVADLRGLGRHDLLVASQGFPDAPLRTSLTVFLQNADGSYGPATGYDVGDYVASWLAVGDLNQDHLLDVAVANAGVPGDPGSVSVLLQDPDHPGTFKAPVLYGGIQGPTSVAIADVDGDGLPDLAIGDGALFVRYQVAGTPGIFGLPYQYRQ